MADIPCEKSKVYRRKINADNTDYLHVIGVGLPRTGTTSLKTALEILGFGPCHHMTELLNKPKQGEIFAQLLDGYETDFRELLKGYRSSVDVPTILFYKELHQIYPKAKFILTVRDSNEQWFECFKNSIAPIWLDDFFFCIIYPLRNLRRLCIVARKIAKKWMHDYGEIGPHIHELHNARMIKENKSDELLVFNVKEGWAPLCKFLNVPIPEDISFPNVNGSGYVKGRLQLARIIGCSAWIFIAVIAVVLIYFFTSFIGL